MQAIEIYEIGKKAYNGNQQAKKQWINKLSKIAVNAGKPYGVLPSLILGKAITESGWGTDLYEVQDLEPRFHIKMQRKSQKHNNLMGMNAFDLNCKYLNNLPKTAWSKYKTTFLDYGPHIINGQYTMTPGQSWKSFINIEDCFQDWAANMRFQAQYHKKQWGDSLKEQLLAIQSYTPEGAASSNLGMHYEWQDEIIELYNNFKLWKYDKEVIMPTKIPMTTANLDQHIKKAYEYAHNFCRYAPCLSMPPMQDGNADCVGLAFRALYTMGYMNHSCNIDQIISLCEAAGMVKTTDIKDVEKYHCVVCFQDNNNRGTNHVNHVFYSLGGSNGRIAKYDLGSIERIKAAQPFTNVAVDEWGNKSFLCAYYIKEVNKKKYKTTVPSFSMTAWTKGEIKKRVGIYEGPGTAWKKIATLEIGTLVDFGPKVTNDLGKDWRRVKTDKYNGYTYYAAVGEITSFMVRKTKIKALGKNDFAALRIGPGTNFEKIAELKGKTQISLKDSVIYNNSKWYYIVVKDTNKKGYVSATLVQ